MPPPISVPPKRGAKDPVEILSANNKVLANKEAPTYGKGPTWGKVPVGRTPVKSWPIDNKDPKV